LIYKNKAGEQPIYGATGRFLRGGGGSKSQNKA
jgi:hypothetical protein